jgi:hypothetical protein
MTVQQRRYPRCAILRTVNMGTWGQVCSTAGSAWIPHRLWCPHCRGSGRCSTSRPLSFCGSNATERYSGRLVHRLADCQDGR